MRRLATLITATLAAAALAWGAVGGIHASAQTSSPGIEIHRAHAGSLAPSFNKTIFVLLLGSDAGAPHYARGGAQERGRSDSIHILGINPDKKTATLIGIPRDSFVPIPGHGTNKINAAMSTGGPSLTVATIEAMSGIRFDYYMLTNFDDFVGMARDWGGLVVNVPYPMHDADSSTDMNPGIQWLDPGRVLGFSRNRHSAPHGDFDRSFNQGTVLITAQQDARKRLAKDPRQLLFFLRVIRRHVMTDIPLPESIRLGLLALSIPAPHLYNYVLSGGTGTTAAGSSVLLDAHAYALLHDVADDGIVENP